VLVEHKGASGSRAEASAAGTGALAAAGSESARLPAVGSRIPSR
jgi:hypothetical protein